MKKIAEYLNINNIENLVKYHISNNIPLADCPFIQNSKEYSDFYKSATLMHKNGTINCQNDNLIIVAKLQKGVEAIYQGRKVKLDSPIRISDGDKKYRVYTNSGKKDKDGNIIAKKIEWGAAGVQIKNDNDEARKNFLKRHQCDTKTDKLTPGWWACNIHLFHKELGLKSSKPW